MAKSYKRFFIIVSLVLSLLLVPLIAMQFTSEVNWSAFDFLVAGILLLGTGLLIELVLRKVKNVNSKTLAIISILILLFLVWAELAVGLFGTPFAGS